MFLVLVIASVLLTPILGVKLPSSFTKCERKQSDFDQCLTKAVQNAMIHLDKAVGEMGLPSLEPLEIPALTLGAGSSAVTFEQKYTNIKMIGLTKAKITKVEFDSAKKKLSLTCIVPKFILDFHYDINGNIMMLPIFGSGPGKILIDDLEMKFEFDLGEVDKKGQKHYKVVGYRLGLKPGKIVFDLANLFDGDKALSDNILNVMNDNWSVVFEDVRPNYEEAFGQIFSSLFDHLLAKVSVEELFGEI